MTPIAYPILRTGRTDIDGSVVVTPSGGSTGTAIVAADLVNGFTPVTVSFAAGETSKPVSFPVADDSAVEGTETYRLTMTNPQPSGAFPSGAFVEGTVGDNDTSGGGGGGNSFGPADTADTTLLDVGTRRQRHSYVHRAATVGHAEMRIGFDAAQQNGVIVRQTTNTTIALYKMVSGVVSDVSSVNYQRPGGFVDGDKISTDVLASGNVVLSVNDTAVNGGGWGVGNLMAGNYARIFNHEQASGVIPSVTITTNNL